MEMHEGREDADGLVVAPVLRRFEQRLTAKDNMENFRFIEDYRGTRRES